MMTAMDDDDPPWGAQRQRRRPKSAMATLASWSKNLNGALAEGGRRAQLPLRRAASQRPARKVFVRGSVLRLVFVALLCVGGCALGAWLHGAWQLRRAEAQIATLAAPPLPAVESELEAFLEHEAGEAEEMRGVLSAIDAMRVALAGNISSILGGAAADNAEGVDGDPAKLAERLTRAVEVVYGEINRHVDPLVAELRNESSYAVARLRNLAATETAQDEAKLSTKGGALDANDVEDSLRCFLASTYSHFKRYGRIAPSIDPLIRESDVATLVTALTRLRSGEWKAWEAKLAFDNGRAFRTGFPSYISYVDDPDEPTVDEMVTYTGTMLAAARFRRTEYSATRLFHRWSAGKLTSLAMLHTLLSPPFDVAIPLPQWLWAMEDDMEKEDAADGCARRVRELRKSAG